jgi:predicted AAA+ superfamily ATPase
MVEAEPRAVIILGKRNTGKTTLINKALSVVHEAAAPQAIFFNKTERVNHNYKTFGQARTFTRQGELLNDMERHTPYHNH